LFSRGQVKKDLYRSQPTSQNELEQQILDTSAAVPLQFWRTAVDTMTCRLQQCVWKVPRPVLKY